MNEVKLIQLLKTIKHAWIEHFSFRQPETRDPKPGTRDNCFALSSLFSALCSMLQPIRDSKERRHDSTTERKSDRTIARLQESIRVLQRGRDKI
jgi:hypothetical protein